jgi:hypothetical protein
MDGLNQFISKEKERLLKKYECNTVGELLQKLQELLNKKQEKQSCPAL